MVLLIKTMSTLTICGICVVVSIIVIYIMWQNRTSAATLSRRARVDCMNICPGETIFVSVPSFRDRNCRYTLLDGFRKARCPFRVFFGVCIQTEDTDPDEIREARRLLKRSGLKGLKRRVRNVTFKSTDATGPMFARYCTAQMYGGEKYVLMIDAHMQFSQDWDEELIRQLHLCPSSKPVLTTYPGGFLTYDEPGRDTNGHYMRFKTFNQNGFPEYENVHFSKRPGIPQPNLFWGACMSFSLASVLQEVPFDPHAPFVFIGEETVMAARLFTSGYDLFCPIGSPVKHMWTRKDRSGTFWDNMHDDDTRAVERSSYRRLKVLFGMLPESSVDQECIKHLDHYGFGSQRSLEEWKSWTGLDLTRSYAAEWAKTGLTRFPSDDEMLTKTGSIFSSITNKV